MGKNIITQLVDGAKARMQTQGEFSRNMLTDLVEETIYEFQHDGLISDDEDIEVIKAEVTGRLKDELFN